MSLLNVNEKNGQYILTRVEKLPKYGDETRLYFLQREGFSKLYRFKNDGKLETLIIGDGNAFLEEGENITITGEGSQASPYIITARTLTARDIEITGFTSTNVEDALLEVLSQIVTNTSQLINDGEDGINPYITALDVDAANVSYINGNLTNVQEALDSLLYVTPVISNFSITPNVVEIGTTVTNAALNWTLNKPFTSLTINNGVGSITPTLTTLSLTGLNLIANTTYTITGGDGTNTDVKSTALNFRAKRWWGISPLSTFTGADILNLQNSELSTNRQQVRTFNGGGDYMWFAFPTSYGMPTFVVNGLPSTAFVTTTVSHTNQSGHTQNYYVTRTTTVQNGTLTIQIL